MKFLCLVVALSLSCSSRTGARGADVTFVLDDAASLRSNRVRFERLVHAAAQAADTTTDAEYTESVPDVVVAVDVPSTTAFATLHLLLEFWTACSVYRIRLSVDGGDGVDARLTGWEPWSLVADDVAASTTGMHVLPRDRPLRYKVYDEFFSSKDRALEALRHRSRDRVIVIKCGPQVAVRELVEILERAHGMDAQSVRLYVAVPPRRLRPTILPYPK